MEYPIDFVNKVVCEDCLSTMKLIPDGFVDLTVTSPPYDGLRAYHGYSFDFESIARELYRVTKDGGVVVWIVGDATVNGSESGSSFRQALFFKEIGFNLHDTMIWQKDSFSIPDKDRYRNCFEYMFILVKGRMNTFNPIEDRVSKYAGSKVHGTTRGKDGIMFKKSSCGTIIKEMGRRFNVWISPSEKNNTFNHPAIFPEALCRDHILSWSNEGDLVYDPFMGSGTTAKMCILHKRNWIGSEISEAYCKIARQRIADTTPPFDY